LPAKDIYDRSLKILAKQYPRPFIKLALGSVENIVYETIENPEINLPERRLDFVYGLQDEEQEYILHLDFQYRRDYGRGIKGISPPVNSFNQREK